MLCGRKKLALSGYRGGDYGGGEEGSLYLIFACTLPSLRDDTNF